MSKETLYKKYRPNSLDGVFGNEEVVASLKDDVEKKSIPQVILFHGPTGCGKTTLARILANELGASKNITELDSAQFTGIDTIREIRKNSRFKAIGGGVRVYLMDEVHMLSSAAQNAFLKELEDTPSHVHYFLCTTNPEKLIAPLKGRCIQYQLNTLTDKKMRELLEKIVKKEKEKLEDEVYDVIIDNGMGHPRNSINILQKVLSVPKKKRLKIAKQYEEEQNEAFALAKAIMNRKPFSEVQEILKGLQSQDAEGIRRMVLKYATSVILSGKDYKGAYTQAAIMLEEFNEPTYNSGFAQIVLSTYSVYYSK